MDAHDSPSSGEAIAGERGGLPGAAGAGSSSDGGGFLDLESRRHALGLLELRHRNASGQDLLHAVRSTAPMPDAHRTQRGTARRPPRHGICPLSHERER